MCMFSAPSAPQTTVPVQYLHNPYLDNGKMGLGNMVGRDSLKINLNPALQMADSGGMGTKVAAPGGAQGPAPASATAQSLRMPIPGTVVPTMGGPMAGALPGGMAPVPSTVFKQPAPAMR